MVNYNVHLMHDRVIGGQQRAAGEVVGTLSVPEADVLKDVYGAIRGGDVVLNRPDAQPAKREAPPPAKKKAATKKAEG